MTNSVSATNSQWEIAGGKKNSVRKVTLNGDTNGVKQTNGKHATAKDFISKIPKLTTNRNLQK